MKPTSAFNHWLLGMLFGCFGNADVHRVVLLYFCNRLHAVLLPFSSMDAFLIVYYGVTYTHTVTMRA